MTNKNFRYTKHAHPRSRRISQTECFCHRGQRVTVHYADLRIIAGRETSSSSETHMFVYYADPSQTQIYR